MLCYVIKSSYIAYSNIWLIGLQYNKLKLDSFIMADSKEKKDSKDKLGINRGIYAAGNAVKDGLIATIIASAGVFAFLQFGDKIPVLGNYAKPLADGIKKLHGSNYGLARLTPGKIRIKEGIISASFVSGGLIAHLFQIKGAKQGNDIAKKAINKYDDAVNARDTAQSRINELENRLAQYEEPANQQPDTFFTEKNPARTTDKGFVNSVTDSRTSAKVAGPVV